MNDQALATTDRRQLLRSRLLRRAADPATALFGRIRWRLTLLFAAVLAAVLLVSGALLYVGMRQTLLGPTDSDLQSAGQQLSDRWLHDGRAPCLLPPAPSTGSPRSPLSPAMTRRESYRADRAAEPGAGISRRLARPERAYQWVRV